MHYHNCRGYLCYVLLLVAFACTNDDGDEILVIEQEVPFDVRLKGKDYDAVITEHSFADTVSANVDSILIDVKKKNVPYEIVRDDTIIEGAVALTPGLNEFLVIFHDGEEYHITIFRRSVAITDIDFDPKPSGWTTLQPNIFSYDLEVPREVYELTISPHGGSNYKILKDDVEVQNPVRLSIGLNKVIVRVTDDTGESAADYTFKINRKPAKVADLFDLSFLNGTLSPFFEKDTYHYILSLPPEAVTFSINSVVDSLASISYMLNGQQILSTDEIPTPAEESLIRVTVLADDRVTTRTYNIRIFRTQWVYKGEGPFSARDGAAILEFNGKLWILGGWNFEGTYSDVWSSQDGVTWEFEANAPWPARHGAGAVVFDDKMWIYSGDGHPDVWSSSDGKNWTQEVSDAPWGRRYAPYCLVFDNKMWIMGGESFYSSSEYSFNDVWSSSDGKNWTQVTDHAPWAARGLIHGSVVFDNKMWIIGGGLKGPENNISYGDVWNSADGITWNLVTSSVPWRPKFHFSIAVHNSKIWMTDGSDTYSENLTNEVWTSSDGTNWVKQEQIPWSPRHASSLKSFNGSLFLICGYLRNDIWMLPP